MSGSKKWAKSGVSDPLHEQSWIWIKGLFVGLTLQRLRQIKRFRAQFGRVWTVILQTLAA